MRATLHRRIAGPHLQRASRVARAVRGAGTTLLMLAVAGPAFAQSGNDAVYRFYNRETGTHFYTISVGERDSVIAAYPQFAVRGRAVRGARAARRAAPCRCSASYNRTTGTHFYTTSASERDGIVAYYPQFAYEGPAYHAMPEPGSDGRVAVYRFFNRNTGAHFYTSSEAERDKVVAYVSRVRLRRHRVLRPSGGHRGGGAGRGPRRATDGASCSRRRSDPRPRSSRAIGAIGVPAYLDEQFAAPRSGYPAGEYDYLSLDESPSCSFAASRSSASYVCARDQLTLFKLRNQFFVNALARPDQLRQRVAWALSQLFVVSGMKDPDMETAYVQARYHEILFDEAFGNFESLLTRVTLSPQMGHYLDMVDNAKADPVEHTEPNENFARELLQLFSIGTVELKRRRHAAARRQGRAGARPTGRARSRRFRASSPAGRTRPTMRRRRQGPNDKRYFGRPMVAVEAKHDTGAKTLLKGAVAPAGQNADADLRLALRNVFAHPNVGPFLAQHLIRQLVTSNPSPAYVARVAAAFNDDGGGVRGDMKAVLRAVLLDPEARGDAKTDPRYGMLKEPVALHHGAAAPARRRQRRQPPVRAGARDGAGRLLRAVGLQLLSRPTTAFRARRSSRRSSASTTRTPCCTARTSCTR